MRAAGAAHRATLFRGGQRIVHNLADRARTAAALGATSEAAIDLTGGARRTHLASGANRFVRDHIARTDDHFAPLPAGLLPSQLSLLDFNSPRKGKTLFKTVLNY
jgi:hypothetical protein